MSKPKRTYQYYVGGHFTFPDDMLRYDQAKIVEVVQERTLRPKRKPGIWLIESPYPPTVGRWQSFLYSVWYEKEKCPF